MLLDHGPAEKKQNVAVFTAPGNLFAAARIY